MTIDSKTKTPSDQATDWLILIRENPEDPSLRSAFEAWLLEAPEHRREWEETCEMWQALGQMPSSALEALPHPAGAPPMRRFSLTSRLVGAAVFTGTALCLLLLAGPSLLIRLQADFVTDTAQSRSITLEDGSSVVLAADSAMALAFSGDRRGVILLKGEAFFDVAPEKTRPFTVEGGGLKVEVLGTAFDVRVGGDETAIALARGAVKTSPDRAGAAEHVLAPGGMLTLDHTSGGITVSAVAIADIGSWRQGRLHVVNQTIGSVIEQIQRYHPALISIPDRSLANRRVSGIYDLNSPDQALGALVDPYGGKVRKISDYVRVISRL
ncbi:FecR family protein [Neorhizobium galegae]|uniref:FecR family protein n=1 Tax=Neorhizobium galegae TaxID=399 RepID=UPI00127A8112|nr:FecR family protein [Neorhizobium galegae]KAA9383464.1 FecR family protein [Neorhizobium galegae]MCM2500185.1 FecR family protein [Neorhizobium galegae]MCQ1769675.1 FecR family protein [Neorhizobium galegae]